MGAEGALRVGVEIMLENIDYWREAPVWTPASIGEATKDWFNCLGPAASALETGRPPGLVRT